MVQPILMCDFVFVFVTTYRSTVNMELEQHMPVRKVGQNLLPQYGGTRLGLASKVPFTLVRYFFFLPFLCSFSFHCPITGWGGSRKTWAQRKWDKWCWLRTSCGTKKYCSWNLSIEGEYFSSNRLCKCYALMSYLFLSSCFSWSSASIF